MEALGLEVGEDLGAEYVDGQGYYVKCDMAYPDLHFLFDRTWLTVQPDDYVRDISAE